MGALLTKAKVPSECAMQHISRLRNIDLYLKMLEADPSDSLRQALLQLVVKEQGKDPPPPRVKADWRMSASVTKYRDEHGCGYR
jgi:hypothetical protein